MAEENQTAYYRNVHSAKIMWNAYATSMYELIQSMW